MYLYTCVVITLCNIGLPNSHINTIFPMQWRETCYVFRVEQWVRKSGQLFNREIEQTCRQEVMHNMEVGPKWHKKRKINMVLKYHEYNNKLLTITE